MLLYVGRISKEKDLDVLAAAYRKLREKHPATRLVFVGDGPYLKELREALPEAFFTGYLSGGDLAKAFASADIFVFPSTTDTFGNVVLEAMASGFPPSSPTPAARANWSKTASPATSPAASTSRISPPPPSASSPIRPCAKPCAPTPAPPSRTATGPKPSPGSGPSRSRDR